VSSRSTRLGCALSVSLLLLSARVSGSESDLKIGPIYLSKIPELEIMLASGSSAGQPAEFEATDLMLLEDGQPTVLAHSVMSLKEARHGVTLGILVDVSGTMNGKPMKDVKAALYELLGLAGPEDRITLLSFAEDLRTEAPFGASAATLRDAVNNLAVRGSSTELYRSLFHSLDLVAANDTPLFRRLIVISDGKDEGSAFRLDDVVARARDLSISIDAFGLTRVERKHLGNLDRLAVLTGGSFVDAENGDDIGVKLVKRLTAIHSLPVASFAARTLRADGQTHRVGVRWSSEGRVVEAELPLRLPQGSSASVGSAGALEAPEDAGRSLRQLPRRVLVLAVVSTLALLLGGLAWLVRRPQAPALSRPFTGEVVAGLQEASLGPSVSPPAKAPLENEPHLSPHPGWSFGEPVDVIREALSSEAANPKSRRTQFRSRFSAPREGAPSACLAGRGGAAEGRCWNIEVDPFWIGAEEGADLRVTSDGLLSAHHAAIRFHQGDLLLYDNASTNGTFVNGERLGDAPRPLALGDTICCGGLELEMQAPLPTESL
jgi:von Willebrand factor type A domain/FHA domain